MLASSNPCHSLDCAHCNEEKFRTLIPYSMSTGVDGRELSSLLEFTKPAWIFQDGEWQLSLRGDSLEAIFEDMNTLFYGEKWNECVEWFMNNTYQNVNGVWLKK